MALPPEFLKKKKSSKEEEVKREGEADEKEFKKGKKKSKKDTEIIKGIEGSEGVTKANDPRKKGAPSLDDENTDACMKKDKKGGKDCGCSHKNDSLTPQEYIAACEAGIQDRSRIYIRARLDAEQRIDKTGSGTGKKCGGSYIPKQATCSKGAGGGSAAAKKEPRLKDMQGYGQGKVNARDKFWKTPGSTEGVGNKLKRGAEFAANAGATAKLAQGIGQYAMGNYGKAIQSSLTAGSLSSMAAASRAGRQGNRALASDFNRQAATLGKVNTGISIARSLKSGQTQYNAKQVYNRGREMGSRWANRSGSYTTTAKQGWSTKMPLPKKNKKDSVWANGFSKTDAETALTANAMNLATDKYKGEKRKKNAQGQPKNMIYANTFNT